MCRSQRELSHEYCIYSQTLASIQPRTRLVKFARSPCTDPRGRGAGPRGAGPALGAGAGAAAGRAGTTHSHAPITLFLLIIHGERVLTECSQDSPRDFD